jgi:hypothetical protein
MSDSWKKLVCLWEIPGKTPSFSLSPSTVPDVASNSKNSSLKNYRKK